MLTIFRKSFTACEQFPALPPTPRKNRRPPALAQGDELLYHALDQCRVELPNDLDRLCQVLFDVGHRMLPAKCASSSTSPEKEPTS